MNTMKSNCDNPPDAVTIFAMPKAFKGHIGIIQRNAIQSWLRLSPRPQVILFGSDEGTAEVAGELGLLHIPTVQRSPGGTPLMDDMFRQAHEQACHDTLAYVNADIILLQDFIAAIDRVRAANIANFLMIGRRIDTNVTEPLDFDSADWDARLLTLVARCGSLAPRVCKDYFVFRKPLYESIPAFAVGRAVFDNWFVYHAHQLGLPVIEATTAVKAIHQNHDYAHVAGGRGNVYLRGEEAKRNRELAGGMHLVSGSSSSWKVTSRGVRRKIFRSHLLQFITDLPRFSRLLMELFGLRAGVRSSPEDKKVSA